MLFSYINLKRIAVFCTFTAAFFFVADRFGILAQTVEYKKADFSDSKKTEPLRSGATSSPSLFFHASSTAVGARPAVVHQKTPVPVRALYMTSCIASGENLRSNVLAQFEHSELNALVIDVKDYTGYVSIDFGNGDYPIGGTSCLVKDMHQFLAELGKRGIYRIARIAVMQDPYYAAKHPEEAVQKKNGGGVWKDKKGLAFVDPGSKKFWQYNRSIAEDAYEAGFDEVNFDYVRYPTDGALHDMYFSLSGTSTKPAMMKKFFAYIGSAMKEKHIPTSVDIFGMTTTAQGDLGIGQVLEDILPLVDYVAPMVYPSHYPTGFNGWKDPNTVPGPLVEFVMKAAVRRAKALGMGGEKFRTWIQDFDYGKDYTLADIEAQLVASERAGVASYMVWDPSNKYTKGAYASDRTHGVYVPAKAATSTATSTVTR